MNIVSRAIAAIAGYVGYQKAYPVGLQGVNDRGWISWWMGRPTTEFQNDIEIRNDQVMAQATVFACITLIAADIGKLCLDLVEEDENGIWTEVDSPAFSPVLRKPNRYQTTQKFVEQWLVSKLSNGNAYILKQRDARQVVTAMYVLDPNRVSPLVAPDGSVYYQLHQDDLSHVPDDMPAVPASEIIHDTMVCLYHPLVGVSPISACGLAATQALKIQQHSAAFFSNMARPSGVLTAPGQIGDETAKRLKDYWETNYATSAGKVAVLGDGLKYEPMSQNAVDADMVAQLRLSAEQVCAVFHVPGYMVGAAPPPAYNNIQALNQQYYSQCLQSLIESLESCLDHGLGLTEIAGRDLGVEFDLDDLLRMDTATLTAALKEQVAAGITSPNEARARLNLSPVAGGDTPYLQQQNYSLAALDKRDTGADPFGKAAAAPASAPAKPADPVEPDDDEAKAMFAKGWDLDLAPQLTRRFQWSAACG